MGRRELGNLGERLAREYLERHGYEVLGQNVRVGKHDEIDLIVREHGVTIFVEVKTRTSDLFGLPEESITPRKRASIERAIIAYVRKHPEVAKVRFDVIAVLMPTEGNRGTLKHF